MAASQHLVCIDHRQEAIGCLNNVVAFISLINNEAKPLLDPLRQCIFIYWLSFQDTSFPFMKELTHAIVFDRVSN